jgi:hypothetical protein
LLATGKSFQALARMRIAPNIDSAADAGIAVDTGKYTIEAYRAPDALRPDPDEARWLTGTSKQFFLELTASVADLLRALYSGSGQIMSIVYLYTMRYVVRLQFGIKMGE